MPIFFACFISHGLVRYAGLKWVSLPSYGYTQETKMKKGLKVAEKITTFCPVILCFAHACVLEQLQILTVANVVCSWSVLYDLSKAQAAVE